MADNMCFDGVLYEMFSWLPAKSLCRMSTVAKSCANYLSEFAFIEKQCHNSCKKTDESLIIQHDSCLWNKDDHLSFILFSENPSFDYGIPPNSLKFLADEGRVLASNNGLVLCRTVGFLNPTTLFLCNPATRTWLPIKEFVKGTSYHYNTADIKIAFVSGSFFGKKDDKFPLLEYTLLLFESHDQDCWNSGYDVYSLEEGEWVLKRENLLTGGRDLNFDDQVFSKDGGLYILSDFGNYVRQGSPHYWPYVFHYDVVNGDSRFLELPHEAREDFYSYTCSLRLFGWERHKDNPWFESICLVKYLNNMITIWVLHEGDTNYDNKSNSSWHMILSIHIVSDLGVKDPATSWTNNFAISDKNLIFAVAKKRLLIYRYCLAGKNFGKLDMIYKYGDSSQRLRFNFYSTTLRPCSKDLIKFRPCKIE